MDVVSDFIGFGRGYFVGLHSAELGGEASSKAKGREGAWGHLGSGAGFGGCEEEFVIGEGGEGLFFIIEWGEGIDGFVEVGCGGSGAGAQQQQAIGRAGFVSQEAFGAEGNEGGRVVRTWNARFFQIGLWAVFLFPMWVLAQGRGKGQALSVETITPDSYASRPMVLLLVLAAMGLAPFVLLMVTSFVKISVVLSIVRSAIGTQQIPPTQVITGLAIILTVYIMSPTLQEMYREANPASIENSEGLLSAKSAGQLVESVQRAREPLRAFLKKRVTAKDKALFYNLARKMRAPAEREGIGADDFLVLTPAFVVSELKQAFQIGFLLFIPFIVVDMLVANILLALGMHMLSPTTISMPFKLLLFVLVDGWYLIAKGLVSGYL